MPQPATPARPSRQRVTVAVMLVLLGVGAFFLSARAVALRATPAQHVPLPLPPPPPPPLSTDDGCVTFCSPGAGACAPPLSGARPDACAVLNVVLRDGSTALEFFAPRGVLPPTLIEPMGPLRFVGVNVTVDAAPPACAVSGTTVLIVNKQQHIPHFSEGLFFALSGLLAGDGASVCAAGRPCALLFHQYRQWPERATIAWHDGALAVAAASSPRAPRALNPDLFNVAGAARAAELVPGCSARALAFERLVVLRGDRSWFTEPAACAAFRNAALRLHGPPEAAPASGAADAEGSARPAPPRGAIALLQRRGSRSIFNLGEVEAAVRARFGEGARKLSFEGLSFAEQVNALRDVRLLVAPHGAGLTNIVFLPAGAALVEILSSHHRPIDSFDARARSCGVWHGAYNNTDAGAAVLDEGCRAAFGERLPALAACAAPDRCRWCGKQSATRVDIARLDAVLAAAQVHLNASGAR